MNSESVYFDFPAGVRISSNGYEYLQNTESRPKHSPSTTSPHRTIRHGRKQIIKFCLGVPEFKPEDL